MIGEGDAASDRVYGDLKGLEARVEAAGVGVLILVLAVEVEEAEGGDESIRLCRVALPEEGLEGVN